MRLGTGPFLNCTELLLLGSPVGGLGRPLLRGNVGPVIRLRVFAADSVATESAAKTRRRMTGPTLPRSNGRPKPPTGLPSKRSSVQFRKGPVPSRICLQQAQRIHVH